MTLTQTTPTHEVRAAVRQNSPRAIIVIVQARAETIAQRIAIPFVRMSLATVMLWFGVPKLIPGGSPAEDVAVRTVEALSGGLVADGVARTLVGLLEVALGLALIIRRWMGLVLLAVAGHMAATFTPLFLFPELTWHGPLVGSLEGQYILKNIVIVACLVTLTAYGLRREGSAITNR